MPSRPQARWRPRASLRSARGSPGRGSRSPGPAGARARAGRAREGPSRRASTAAPRLQADTDPSPAGLRPHRASTVPAVADLVYSAIASLDGYVADEQGAWDWSVPDDAVHAHVNDLTRPLGTWLLGRRMYEVMAVWETMDDDDPAMRDFAEIWRSADKVVYSRTLEAASTARTRIERAFDPEAVGRMKAESERDLGIGGPELAALAFQAGLIDEIQLFLSPVIVGGGKPALPDGVKVSLELLDERRFANAVVHLRYRVVPA